MKTKILTLLALVLLASSVQAWNAHGHRIVAAIAYAQLNDDQKAGMTDLLTYHPEYLANWKAEYEALSEPMELGAFLMLKASVWPDEIRGEENPNHKFHRPEWHYITYKIQFPRNHETGLPKEEPSVVWAIEHCSERANDPTLTNEVRAMYMAWVIHLIGDVHQPLHCGSLFNELVPKGDAGGNLFYVNPGTGGVRLHSLWDGSLGRSSDLKAAMDQANEIMGTTPKNKVVLNFLPKEWSMESFRHCLNDVHLKGKLPGSLQASDAPGIPADYISNMETLSAARAAAAGYRLSAVLDGLTLRKHMDYDHND